MDTLIREVNTVGVRCIFDDRQENRRQGDYTPLQFRKEGLYKGFLSDWSGDCRVRLRSALLALGFKSDFYKAKYHFGLINEQGVRLEYVEGDLYLTTDTINHA